MDVEEDEEDKLPPPMPPPIPQGGIPDEDFFRYRIDGKDILDEMEHMLKGEVYDPLTKKYEQKFDRWINDKGINKALYAIYACGINKNTFLGNLTKDEINTKCESLWRDLSLLFFKKYQIYGIQKEMRNLLIKSIIFPIHSAMSRSEGGRESDQLSTAAQRHEIFTRQEQKQDRPTGLPRFPFMRRNR